MRGGGGGGGVMAGQTRVGAVCAVCVVALGKILRVACGGWTCGCLVPVPVFLVLVAVLQVLRSACALHVVCMSCNRL